MAETNNYCLVCITVCIVNLFWIVLDKIDFGKVNLKVLIKEILGYVNKRIFTIVNENMYISLK